MQGPPRRRWDGLLTVSFYSACEQIENAPMDSVSAEATQSWFVAKVAVALIPVVILTTADVIGWLMRMLRRHTAKAPQSEP